MEFFKYYVAFGLIIFLVYGVKSGQWNKAVWVSLLWPLWVGYILISLLWGVGAKN